MICSVRRRLSMVAAFVAAAVLPSLAFAAPVSPQDIRDIRGPIAISPWWRWPLAAALAALLVMGVVLFVRWWRARSSRALSPLERARLALAEAEAHARDGRSREWAEIVAETTRGALATRLGTDVLPQTTAELAKGSWTKPPIAEAVDAPRLLALLETCDLARFARAHLDAPSLLTSTALARELTERLLAPRPKPAVNPSAHAEPVPS